jgi:hypothetical protein
MIIAHRGNIRKPNNLIEAINIYYKYNIDMIEIDVIYHNDTFIVAHDHDSINKDTMLLETWLKVMKILGIKLWLDLKDTYKSIITNNSEFNLIKFNNIIKGYNTNIIISSHFSTISDNLKKYNNINKFNIIDSVPHIFFYIIRYIPASNVFRYFYNIMVQHITLSKIKNTTSIVALDYEFFNNITELYRMILQLKSNEIIISINEIFIHNTNCKLDDIPGKTIHYVYDYRT